MQCKNNLIIYYEISTLKLFTPFKIRCYIEKWLWWENANQKGAYAKENQLLEFHFSKAHSFVRLVLRLQDKSFMFSQIACVILQETRWN